MPINQAITVMDQVLIQATGTIFLMGLQTYEKLYYL